MKSNELSSGTEALERLRAVRAPALAQDRLTSWNLAGKIDNFFKTSLKRFGPWLAGEIMASAR